MTARIDLNCDVGEGFGVYTLGHDEELLPLVSSVSVACGFHASDPGTMHRTVCLARKHGVAIGAHPSFPDVVGFGRRHLAASPEEIHDDVLYQLGALAAFCRAEGVPLRHVKPHGALYDAAARNLTVALAVAKAVKALDPALWLVSLSSSSLVEAARQTGLHLAQEVFSDRAYSADGTLVSRRAPGAVIDDPDEVAPRVLRIVRDGKVRCVDGTDLPVRADTVCVHGDTPGAVRLVLTIRETLLAEGIEIAPFWQQAGA